MSKNIIAVVDDLFFTEKIRGTANYLNIPVVFVCDELELFEQLEKSSPNKIILDLNNNATDPISLLQKLKSNEGFKNIPTVGYLSHVQKGLKEKAASKGCDYIMPKSEFTQNLAEILRSSF